MLLTSVSSENANAAQHNISFVNQLFAGKQMLREIEPRFDN